MIDWLQQLDVSLFRFVNGTLSNAAFDWAMPLFSSPPYLPVILIAVFIWLLCKGGARGRICALLLLLGLWVGDSVVCNSMKHACGRLRPFQVLAEVHHRSGVGTTFSMPSSHAANWFSAAVIAFIYYRRSLWFMLPMALAVSFSRVYNGVHYPSDVLVGILLGAGTGAFLVWTVDALWQRFGQSYFPVWFEKLPSLMNPVAQPVTSSRPPQLASMPPGEVKRADLQWLRLGYLLVGLLLLLRLVYLASGKIELSEDEAYQWIWSKHLALSYYSKPPLIAYTQFLGTHLWGDTQFGVRFFSPVISAVLSILVLRFFAREVSAKVGVALILIVSTAPLMALGSTLMTVDPLSVLFWMAALIAGWRAVQPDGTTRQWCWTGLWMGLGFLSKYTNLFQLLCWSIFFCLWSPARKHLRRPGPYLALLINALATIPVLLWNSQHKWITVKHVASNGSLNEPFVLKFHWTRDFILSEFGLLHPVFFVATVWAATAFWRSERRNPLMLFFFSMGAPLVLFYFVLSFQSGIFPNWIAPAVLPLFCLMGIYWAKRWEANRCALNRWFIGSVIFGAFVVVLTHDTDLIAKIIHRPLPGNVDPLHRVHGWKSLAQTVGDAHRKLEAEGKPAFIIGGHYGFTSLVTFYLPEAKRCVQDKPLVYAFASGSPQNQFYFWPNYLSRKGENAIFFREIGRPPLRQDWFRRWWAGSADLFEDDHEQVGKKPLVPGLTDQFESIQELGIYNVIFENRVMRRVQLFACRNLK